MDAVGGGTGNRTGVSPACEVCHGTGQLSEQIGWCGLDEGAEVECPACAGSGSRAVAASDVYGAGSTLTSHRAPA